MAKDAAAGSFVGQLLPFKTSIVGRPDLLRPPPGGVHQTPAKRGRPSHGMARGRDRVLFRDFIRRSIVAFDFKTSIVGRPDLLAAATRQDEHCRQAGSTPAATGWRPPNACQSRPAIAGDGPRKGTE